MSGNTTGFVGRLPVWMGGPLSAGGAKLTDLLGGPARRRAILLLAAILSLDSADKGAIGALAPQLEAAFHIGNLEIGILVTVSSLVGAVATLPLGVLVDRTNRSRLLTVSILIWGVTEALGGLSFGYLMLLLTRIALGGVTATAGPSVASLLGDLFPAKERSRIYGFVLTGELLGTGAGLLISGDLGAGVSWRAGFIVLALPSVALAWAIRRYLPEPARGGQSWLNEGDEEITPGSAAGEADHTDADGGRVDRGPTDRDSAALRLAEERGIEPEPAIVLSGDLSRMDLWSAVRWVLKVRTNVLLIVSSCLGYFFFAGLRTYAVLFARGRYGISESVATLLAVLVGGAAIIGILIASRVADQMLQHGRLTARLLVGGICYIACTGAFVPALLTTSLAIALPLVLIGAATLSAPESANSAARLDVVPSLMWGRAEGIRTFLRSLLEAFAPLLFGFVSELFGSGSHTGFGSGVNSKSAHVSAVTGRSLAFTFLVMLAPLALSGYFLLRARRSYPTDVASAAQSERQTGSAGTGEAAPSDA